MVGTSPSPQPAKRSENAGSHPLAAALNRLNTALDGLHATVDERLSQAANPENVDQQVQKMAEDRAKLASELDAATARAETLKSVNAEVSRRLVDAMEQIRSIIEKRA